MKEKNQFKHATLIAFQTVKVWAITKSKKGRMPTFESLLPKEHKDVRQSAAEMKAAIDVIAGQYGNRVRRLERASK